MYLYGSVSHLVMADSCNTMDCSPPASSVHGLLQARILEWVAICFPRGSSQPRHQIQVSCTAGRFFTVWSETNTPLSINYTSIRASLVAQMVKNLPAMWETWVWSMCWDDLLEKGMATHSRILAWRISWTNVPGELSSMGLQTVGYDWVTNNFTFIVDLIC